MTKDLTLTPRERDLAKFLKKKYGFKWPFAAHIAKDVLHWLDYPREQGS